MTGKLKKPDCTQPPPMPIVDGMARPKSNKVPVTFRLTPAAAARVKQWLADQAGKPLYEKPGPFAERALLREIERQDLILAGALPPDGGDPVKGRKTVIDNVRKRIRRATLKPIC
jgi:hypothetical protein